METDVYIGGTGKVYKSDPKKVVPKQWIIHYRRFQENDRWATQIQLNILGRRFGRLEKAILADRKSETPVLSDRVRMEIDRMQHKLKCKSLTFYD